MYLYRFILVDPTILTWAADLQSELNVADANGYEVVSGQCPAPDPASFYVVVEHYEPNLASPPKAEGTTSFVVVDTTQRGAEKTVNALAAQGYMLDLGLRSTGGQGGIVMQYSPANQDEEP